MCSLTQIIANDSESFEKAIEHLNTQDKFFVSVLEMMHPQVVSRKGAVVAAVQFLNTVTEDNEVLSRKFAENQAACKFLIESASLKAHANEDSSLIRILVTSETFILRNERVRKANKQPSSVLSFLQVSCGTCETRSRIFQF